MIRSIVSMQISRVAVVYSLVGIFSISLAYTCVADDGSACTFRGIVDIRDYEIAGGTRITATIEGDEYHTHTPLGPDSSTYSITIRPEDGKNYPDGAEVVFSINGYSAEQTGIYYAGSDFNLNLTTMLYQPVQQGDQNPVLPYGSTEGTSTTFKWGMFAGLFVGTLLTVGMTYYAFIIRRLMKRKLKADMEVMQTQSTKS